MRKFVLIALFAFIASLTYGQAYESSITYDKKKQEAFVMDYSYSSEAVENAIVEKMKKLGFKSKEEKGLFNKDKGFLVFSNAYVTDITNNGYDYLVKVESKGKKGDAASLYMVMHRNKINVRSRLEPEEAENAKKFLVDLTPDVVAADLEIQINAQADLVAKAEKKLSKLRDEQADLEKRLDKNKKDQDDTITDIENKTKELEALKSRRN